MIVVAIIGIIAPIVWMIPAIKPGGGVRWTCRGHTGDGGAGWQIKGRFLPASCRD